MDIDVNMPDIGFDQVEVTEILVQAGEKVSLEQSLITVEGDKSSIEIPSSIAGIIKKIHVKIGDKVSQSSLIVTIEDDSITMENSKNVIGKIKENNTSLCQNFSNVHATPWIRRLARKLKINLNDIKPSGRKNRILKEDIELYQKNHYLENDKNNNFCSKDDLFFQDIDTDNIEEYELTSIQKVVGNNLSKNWKNIPHVTHFDEVDITKLDQFRQKHNNKNNKNDHITILVFIIKVIAHVLKVFPRFNSSLSSDHTKIFLKNYINIGIAVEISNGLVVPVLRNVDKKNILDIASDLKIISKKAKDSTLDVLDMKDGGFTISSLGGIGGSYFSPIINAPEVAILGVSKAVVKPLWKKQEFIPALMLPLSLSYDHRVINGADAARFMALTGKILSDLRFLIM